MADKAVDPVERFRDTLRETITVIEKLAPLCGSVAELVDVMKLALHNEGQLTLLLREVLPLQLKR